MFVYAYLFDSYIVDGYPKIDVDPLDTYYQLKELFPNASPAYLKEQADVLAFKSETELKRFIENAVENNDYPTLQSYLQ